MCSINFYTFSCYRFVGIIFRYSGRAIYYFFLACMNGSILFIVPKGYPLANFVIGIILSAICVAAEFLVKRPIGPPLLQSVEPPSMLNRPGDYYDENSPEPIDSSTLNSTLTSQDDSQAYTPMEGYAPSDNIAPPSFQDSAPQVAMPGGPQNTSGSIDDPYYPVH